MRFMTFKELWVQAICLLGFFLNSNINGDAQPLLHSLQLHRAMGAVVASSPVQSYSAAVNPAFIASASTLQCALGGEQRFLAPGWIEFSSSLVVPVSSGAWAIMIGQEGLPFSYEQQAVITHGRKIGNDLSVGASLGVRRIKANQFAAVLSTVGAVGLVIPVSSSVKTSLSLTYLPSVSSVGFSKKDYSVFRFSLGYTVSEKIQLMAAVTKQALWPSAGCIAMQYQPQQKMGFSAGFAGSPSMVWFGLQLGLGTGWILQLHSGYYPLTGVSNGMNLSYVKQEKNNWANEP